MQAAQAKLAAAREAQDLKAEAEALTAISELGYKKAKLEETKVAQEEFNKNKKEEPELKLEKKLSHNKHQIQKQRHGQLKMHGLVKIML